MLRSFGALLLLFSSLVLFASARVQADDPIVFNQLLLIKPPMSQAEIDAVKQAFQNRIPKMVSDYTHGRVQWHVDVEVSPDPLASLTSVQSTDKDGKAATVSDIAPKDIQSDLSRYKTRGKYDTVFVYAPQKHPKTGTSLIGGDAGMQWPGAFNQIGSGLATIVQRPGMDWTNDTDACQGVIHEWMHTLEDYYKRFHDVNIPDDSKKTFKFQSSDPSCPIPTTDMTGAYGIHDNAIFGYCDSQAFDRKGSFNFNQGDPRVTTEVHQTTTHWQNWYTAFLNGSLTYPGSSKQYGFGEAAWAHGTETHPLTATARSINSAPPITTRTTSSAQAPAQTPAQALAQYYDGRDSIPSDQIDSPAWNKVPVRLKATFQQGFGEKNYTFFQIRVLLFEVGERLKLHLISGSEAMKTLEHIESAIRDWNHKFPDDPEIPKRMYELYQHYAQIANDSSLGQSQFGSYRAEAAKHADQMKSELIFDFPVSKYAVMARRNPPVDQNSPIFPQLPSGPNPTPIVTYTPTPTPIVTYTPTPTPIVTYTPTPTPIVTYTPTPMPTVTYTPTPMPTVTYTPTPTPTATYTPGPLPTSIPQQCQKIPASSAVFGNAKLGASQIENDMQVLDSGLLQTQKSQQWSSLASKVSESVRAWFSEYPTDPRVIGVVKDLARDYRRFPDDNSQVEANHLAWAAVGHAPADQYFGNLKMSVLGIRNTLTDTNSKIDSNPSDAGQFVVAAKNMINALFDWQHNYPLDSDLFGKAQGIHMLLMRIGTPEATNEDALLQKRFLKIYPCLGSIFSAQSSDQQLNSAVSNFNQMLHTRADYSNSSVTDGLGKDATPPTPQNAAASSTSGSGL